MSASGSLSAPSGLGRGGNNNAHSFLLDGQSTWPKWDSVEIPATRSFRNANVELFTGNPEIITFSRGSFDSNYISQVSKTEKKITHFVPPHCYQPLLPEKYSVSCHGSVASVKIIISLPLQRLHLLTEEGRTCE